MLEPHYQIVKDKLKEVKFKDMKLLFPTIDKFKKEVDADMEKKGLLCPIVLDKDGITIRSGAHRHEYFKDKDESTLCYMATSQKETKFFQLLNIFCWRNHPVQNPEFLKQMYDQHV